MLLKCCRRFASCFFVCWCYCYFWNVISFAKSSAVTDDTQSVCYSICMQPNGILYNMIEFNLRIFWEKYDFLLREIWICDKTSVGLECMQQWPAHSPPFPCLLSRSFFNLLEDQLFMIVHVIVIVVVIVIVAFCLPVINHNFYVYCLLVM